MFQEIQPKDWCVNPFEAIGTEWMLIAAAQNRHANAMTASWGGVGVLWGKNVAYIFVRDSRYTKELIDKADTFSITFFDRPEYDEMLTYMGRTSGRDEDKIAHCALTLCYDETGTPYFQEAKTVLLCRKLSRTPIRPEDFLDDSIDARFYRDKDYHDMYVGEIQRIMVKTTSQPNP